MPDLISDGAEFSCKFCTSKLKLTVTSSSTTGDSKKLANEGNCFFPPPGGNCTFPPGSPPSPCPGIPPSSVSATGQTTVKIDGQTALGDGCTFMCPKGQTASLSSPGQTIVKHDEASGGSNAIIIGAVVLLGIALALFLLPEELLVGAAVAVVKIAKSVPKLLRKGVGKPPKSSPPKPASAPGGSSRAPQQNAPYQKTRNQATVIQNRKYSGHAVDQMQNRGIPPRVVENTVKEGVPSEKIRNGLKTTNYYDKGNNVSVVLNDKGEVITVGHGKIGR